MRRRGMSDSDTNLLNTCAAMMMSSTIEEIFTVSVSAVLRNPRFTFPSASADRKPASEPTAPASVGVTIPE